MSDTRVQCRQCSHLILPETGERTGGLCMPCWKRDKGVKKETRNTRWSMGVSYDVPLPEVEVPGCVYGLLQACEVHCLICCCGFRALELSAEIVAAHLDTLATAERVKLKKEFRQMLNAVEASPASFKVLGDTFGGEEFHALVKPVTDALLSQTTEA